MLHSATRWDSIAGGEMEPDLTPHPRGLAVLVVEDEILVAMDIELALQARGHRVIGPVPTVAAALGLLHDTRPDLALLDFNLRGETVLPVAARLAELSVPVLLMSAYGAAELGRHSVLAGAGLLPKPFTDDDLSRALAAVAQG
jgi:DNA-binding response OmpR family regulator